MLRLVESLANVNLFVDSRWLRRLIDRDLGALFDPAPSPIADATLRISTDRRCSIESIERDGIAERITFRCSFDSLESANVFLRHAAASLGRPLIPPLPDDTSPALHHRAIVSTSAGLAGVDLDLFPSAGIETASMTLTRGRRILLYAHNARPGGGMADAADLKSAAP